MASSTVLVLLFLALGNVVLGAPFAGPLAGPLAAALAGPLVAALAAPLAGALAAPLAGALTAPLAGALAAPVAAPLAGVVSDALQFPPGSGGSGSRFWHTQPFELKWETHTRTIDANFTSNMPGWQSAWGPHDHTDASDASTKLAARSGGTGIFGHVVNKCPTTVYVHTTLGDNSDVGIPPMDDPADPVGTYPIPSGSTYTTTIQSVINGHGGVSVKIGHSSTVDNSQVYQIEYATAQDGNGNVAVWYDLSQVNGDPFIGSARYMQIGVPNSGCTGLYNAPGSTSADWPYAPGACDSVQDVYFWLC